MNEFDQNADLCPCVWSAGAVSAARLSHTGTMRRTTGSSVRRTTGLNLGSCVMAARSPSPPDSSWWVQTVRNPISAVSPHPTVLLSIRLSCSFSQPLQLHHFLPMLHSHSHCCRITREQINSTPVCVHERAAIYNSDAVFMKGVFVWPVVLMHSLLAVLFSVSTRARAVYLTRIIYDCLNSFIVPESSR